MDKASQQLEFAASKAWAHFNLEPKRCTDYVGLMVDHIAAALKQFKLTDEQRAKLVTAMGPANEPHLCLPPPPHQRPIDTAYGRSPAARSFPLSPSNFRGEGGADRGECSQRVAAAPSSPVLTGEES